MLEVLRGDVSSERLKWFADHVTTCASCRQEFQQQRRLQRARSRFPVEPVDAEAGFKRLLARLDMPQFEEASGSLRFVPDPAVTLAEWNASLHSHALKFIDGPNDVGAYIEVSTASTNATQNSELVLYRHGVACRYVQ
jgi:hypothetical protein